MFSLVASDEAKNVKLPMALTFLMNQNIICATSYRTNHVLISLEILRRTLRFSILKLMNSLHP